MLKQIQYSLFLLLLSTVALGNPMPSTATTEAYIVRFKDMAVREMHRTGIPASIKLAQAILESGAGTSELASKANNHFGIKCGGSWKGDTYQKKDDERNRAGVKIKSCFRVYDNPDESFKAHSEFLMNPAKRSRYGFLFDYKKTDYKSWAKGLKKAGYATNPKYPELLMKVIQDNDLQQFDYWLLSDVMPEEDDEIYGYTKPTRTSSKPQKPRKENTENTTTSQKPKKEKEDDIITFSKPDAKPEKEQVNNPDKYREQKPRKEESDVVTITKPKQKKPVKEQPSKPKNTYEKEKYKTNTKETNTSAKHYRVFYSNDIRTVFAKKGDTPKTIAKRHKISVSKLLEYNDLKSSKTFEDGDLVYLQPKRKSHRGKTFYHIVSQESMYDISQRYGIQLDELYAKNRMKSGQEPAFGEKIYLKTKRKNTPKLRQKQKQSQAQAPKKEKSTISKIEEDKPKKPKAELPQKKSKYPVHTVRKGDTLYAISRKYSVTVDEIKKWNDLKTNTLEVGQELIIKKE